MDELVVWIREQIAEDLTPRRWATWHAVWCLSREVVDGSCFYCGEREDPGKFEEVPSQPTTLALCEAHEALLNLHLPAWAEPINRDGYPPNWNICKTCGSGEGDEYPVDWPCATVKHLAGAYRLRPGYREEWRP